MQLAEKEVQIYNLSLKNSIIQLIRNTPWIMLYEPPLVNPICVIFEEKYVFRDTQPIRTSNILQSIRRCVKKCGGSPLTSKPDSVRRAQHGSDHSSEQSTRNPFQQS